MHGNEIMNTLILNSDPSGLRSTSVTRWERTRRRILAHAYLVCISQTYLFFSEQKTRSSTCCVSAAMPVMVALLRMCSAFRMGSDSSVCVSTSVYWLWGKGSTDSGWNVSPLRIEQLIAMLVFEFEVIPFNHLCPLEQAHYRTEKRPWKAIRSCPILSDSTINEISNLCFKASNVPVRPNEVD